MQISLWTTTSERKSLRSSVELRELILSEKMKEKMKEKVKLGSGEI
jgi:hypothetical protein